MNPKDLQQPTLAESQAILEWVGAGGSLLLVVDHSPGHGIQTLGGELGIEVGIATALTLTGIDGCPPLSDPCIRAGGSFIDFVASGPTAYQGTITAGHPVIAGRSPLEEIRVLRTFDGIQYDVVDPKPEVSYTSLLVLPEVARAAVVVSRDPAWVIEVLDYGGWSMGLAIEYGQGRIYIHGEAASLTAQAKGPNRLGIHDGYSEDNEQYVLNLLHWLDGTL